MTRLGHLRAKNATVESASGDCSAPAPRLRRAVVSASVLSVVSQVVRVGTAFVSVPLCLNYLGSERYGLWMVSVSTMLVLSLFDAGISPAIRNGMATALARNEMGRFRYLSSAGLTLGLAALGIGIALLPALQHLPWHTLLGARAELAVDARHVVTAVYAVSLCNFALASVEGSYAAKLELATVYSFNIAAGLAAFGALVFAVKHDLGLPVLAIAASSGPTLSRLALAVRLLCKEPALLIPRWRDMRRIVRDVGPGSAAFLALQSANVAITAAPGLLVAQTLGLESAAVLNIGQRLASLPLVALAAIAPVFWPVFTIAWERGERAWIWKRLRLAVFLTMFALVAYAAVLVVALPTITRLWLHDRILVPSLVVVVFGGWLVCQGVLTWMSTFLNGISDVWYQVVCSAAQLLVLGALGVPLAGALGLPGFVAAMATASLIGSLIPLHIRARQRLAVNEEAAVTSVSN